MSNEIEVGTAEHHPGADLLQPCWFLEKCVPWVVATGAGMDRWLVYARAVWTGSWWVYPAVIEKKKQ